MGIAWLIVMLLSLGVIIRSALRGDNRNVINFSIITAVALSMYLIRRRQRKKS